MLSQITLLLVIAYIMTLHDKSVLVENLPVNLDSSTIKQFFSSAGTLQEYVPLTADSGFLVFESSDSVGHALASFHEKVFQGIKVSVSHVGEDQETKLRKMLREATVTKSDVAELIQQLASLTPQAREAVSSALLGLQHLEGASGGLPQLLEPSPSPSPSPVVVPHANVPVTAQVVPASGLPRLSLFSGDAGTKGEVTFAQWQYEVMSLTEEGRFSEGLILQMIRKSLRGTAAELLVTLGAHPKVAGVLKTFNGLFAEVYSAQTLMAEFYTSKQGELETIATWACRLEELLGKLQSCDPDLDEPAILSMKRSQFFKGLTNTSIRSALRHHFDTGAPYDKLLMAARVTELEETSVKKQPSKGKINQIGSDPVMSALGEIKDSLTELKKRVSTLESQKSKGPNLGSSQAEVRKRPTSTHPNRSQSNSQPNLPIGRFNGKCFKCQRFAGHLARDCHLNENEPTSRGSR
jgi:polyhydroxyalkanoate synthesis regulator phasin